MDFLEFHNYDLCVTDRYTECLAYLVYNSPFACKYVTTCGKAYKHGVPKLLMNMLNEKETRDIFYNLSVQFCLSQDKHNTCAKYKIYEEGKVPPINLLPDGSKSGLIDLLLKRKLLAHPPE
jgi:hypothetical protein